MDTREAGAKGGKSRSAIKRASSARNLEKARAARRDAAAASAADIQSTPQTITDACVPTRPAVLLVVK
jgi:hypothetical protein